MVETSAIVGKPDKDLKIKIKCQNRAHLLYRIWKEAFHCIFIPAQQTVSKEFYIWVLEHMPVLEHTLFSWI
jgi:hypothetical protein